VCTKAVHALDIVNGLHREQCWLKSGVLAQPRRFIPAGRLYSISAAMQLDARATVEDFLSAASCGIVPA
jgi:hypothetical protein